MKCVQWIKLAACILFLVNNATSKLMCDSTQTHTYTPVDTNTSRSHHNTKFNDFWSINFHNTLDNDGFYSFRLPYHTRSIARDGFFSCPLAIRICCISRNKSIRLFQIGHKEIAPIGIFITALDQPFRCEM